MSVTDIAMRRRCRSADMWELGVGRAPEDIARSLTKNIRGTASVRRVVAV